MRSVLSISVVTCAIWLINAAEIRQDHSKSIQERLGQSHNHITHLWGQYSPYFPVDSEVPVQPPSSCSITFAQALSRHGARDPTESRWHSYHDLIRSLQNNVSSFSGNYTFLEKYELQLGKEQLTEFGREQMRDSGKQFFQRYQTLARHYIPFVRASNQGRVIESAQRWIEGFTKSINVHIPILPTCEDKDFNSTLSHGLCTNFETGPTSRTGYHAKKRFGATMLPGIQHRLHSDMPGANLSMSQVIALMDLCPFETVATIGATLSPFCNLFTYDEWHAYNYYQTLGKFYGHGNGNALGPTQGVGFVNELMARMTDTPVSDSTSTNRTLDNNPITFPLGRKLYADFTHDNEMTEILAALGLYNRTEQLSNSTINRADSDQAAGYSAAWTVPFAARIYFEKMRCSNHKEELVRIIVNDRVVPLINCGADDYGRCSLSTFIESQSFARSSGLWNECFKTKEPSLDRGPEQAVLSS